MKDLIEALTIFAKYAPADSHSPTHCEHDVLHIMDVSEDVSPQDAKRLDELGFLWSETDKGWISFRFGSA